MIPFFSKYMNFKMGWFQPPTSTNFKKTTKENTEKIAAVLAVPWMVDPRSKPTAPKRPDRPTGSWRRRPVERPGRAHQGHPGALEGLEGIWWARSFWGEDLEDGFFPGKQTVYANVEAWGVRFFCWNKMGLAILFVRKLNEYRQYHD